MQTGRIVPLLVPQGSSFGLHPEHRRETESDAAPSGNAEEFPTSAGAVRLTPIEHAAVLLQRGGKSIYVDPALPRRHPPC